MGLICVMRENLAKCKFSKAFSINRFNETWTNDPMLNVNV